MKSTLLAAICAAAVLLVAVVMAQTGAGNPTVQGSLRNATVDQVTRWLQSKGVSFVVPSSAVPAAVQVSLNFQDVPIQEALDAISQAWGGKWERNGKVYRFIKAKDDLRPGLFEILKEPTPPQTPEVRIPIEIAPSNEPPPVIFEWSAPDNKRITEMARALAKKAMELEAMGVRGEEAAKALESSALELAKAAMGSKIPTIIAPSEWKNFDPKAAKEFRQHMEKFSKEFSKEFPEKSKHLSPELRKKLDEEFTRIRIEIPKHLQELEHFKFEIPQMKKDASAEEREKFKKQLEEFRREFRKFQFEFPSGDSKKQKSLEQLAPLKGMHEVDVKKLYASMTTAQWELQKSRGYLTFADLNHDQIALLGAQHPHEDWSLEFLFDGKQLRIKSR